MRFERFYQSHRGREPFPWMIRLAERMAKDELPEVIDLATGSGKSDIVFVWAWARQANPTWPRRLRSPTPPPDRRVPIPRLRRWPKG